MGKKFKERERVRMTQLGKRRLFVYRKPTVDKGILISHNPPFVRILRDGHKSIETYHQDFWTKED